MNIKYWTSFPKRKNSTKVPTGGTSATVYLKDPCGIASPTFVCHSIPENVKYIQAWSRYYFVSEVTHVGSDIEISCVSDPMATFKSAISGLYADVEYTSSSSNTDITDPRNRPTNNVWSNVTTLVDLSSYGFSTTGGYIIGVVSNQGFNYYYLTQNMFDIVCKNLLDLDTVSDFANTFFNVSNAIVSCIWTPYEPDHGNTLDPITIGFDSGHTTIMDLGVGYKITQRTELIAPTATAITFPTDSLGLDFSYLDVAPYTTGTLYLPFVGLVPLDIDVVAQNKSILFNIAIDQIACEIGYKVMRPSGEVIATYQGSYGASIPLASQGAITPPGQSYAPLMAIGGFVSAVTGAATGSYKTALGGLGAELGALGLELKSPSLNTQVNGSLGSVLSTRLGLAIRATIITRQPAETDIDNAYKSVSGMPYFKGDTIGNLSGFVKCNGASIEIDGFDSDRDTINGYLNSGFYYE